MPQPLPSQPIVILGGFLIGSEAYAPMAERLRLRCGQPVQVLPLSRADWLLTLFPWGWARILDRLQIAVADLAQRSATGRVTLIGHSSGGIMVRLFLDHDPFLGRRYDGKRWSDTVILLGSPHVALKATAMRQMVQRRLPGAFFRDRVHYLSVAGDLELQQGTPLARRLAPSAYRNSTGDADDRGDGLVPVSTALLEGSTPLVLPGVAHGGAFGARWYGTPEVVDQWWSALHRVEG